MLPVETELHVRIKVDGEGLRINDLVEALFERRDALTEQVVAQVLWQVQEARLGEILAGRAEITCRGCGVVETGAAAVVRRGRRRRCVRTSMGRIGFDLRQVTCRACGKTWCPFVEMLGLAPRQRVLEELLRRLVDWVTELSYAKTTRLAGEWLGETVSPRTLHAEVQRRGSKVAFTEEAPVRTLVADGTKVPAGSKQRGEDVSVAYQLQGRRSEAGRPRVSKRVVGFGTGYGHWQETLATESEPELLVTDGERGLRELASWYYPDARHQRCEWHVPYSLGHMLGLDGMSVDRRRRESRRLSGILARGGAQAKREYRRTAERISGYPRARTLLDNAEPYVLYDPPSEERTTSVVEREMRELNRRTDVGARWTLRGIGNLLKLRLAKRHNPDDYQRVWTPLQKPAISLVLQA